MKRLGFLAIAIAAALSSGCEGEVRAQLVVVLHTDMAIPDQLDATKIRVLAADDPGAEPAREQTIFLGTGDGLYLLPQSFGVLPRNGDPSHRVRIEAEAHRDGATLFETHAITSFVRGARLRLDMYLAARCIDEAMTCEPDETCGRDGCQPAEIDPSRLPRFTAGAPLEPDAGAAGDAGGRPETFLAVCSSDAECGPGLFCETLEGAGSRCRPHCTTDAECGAGARCAAIYEMGVPAAVGVCTDGCTPFPQSGCPPELTCGIGAFAAPAGGGSGGAASYCRGFGPDGPGRPCDGSSQCGASMICAGGRCTRFCATDADCRGVDRCDALVDVPGVRACGVSRTDAAVEVSAGGLFTCARNSGGVLYCWGENTAGQLGVGAPLTPRLVPTPVALPDVAEIAAGGNHVCARDRLRHLWCWGDDSFGEVGDGGGPGAPVTTPVRIAGEDTTQTITAGGAHTCAARTDGTVRCWGLNDVSQLGDGTMIDRDVPTLVMGLPGANVHLAAGAGHTCAGHGSGLECWGDDARGQLGDGSLGPVRSTPAPAPMEVSFALQLTAGEEHTCALVGPLSVLCTGANDSGQLGNAEAMSQRALWQPVLGLDDAMFVDAGLVHTCALRSNGVAVCWGDNTGGRLGTGDTAARNVPADVAHTGLGFATISAGDRHTCAITVDGILYCWGDNTSGQLGTGVPGGSLVPVAIPLP